MRTTLVSALGCALGITRVAAHATFQNLWVNGVDYISAPSYILSRILFLLVVSIYIGQ